MRGRSALIVFICATLALTGCHTMQPVDVSGQVPLTPRLAPNDSVRVWMRDGRVLDLKLTAVEADAIVCGEQRLPLKDIERIERRTFSPARTVLLTAGITFVVLLATVIGLLVTHRVGFMPGPS